ncbi:MAG TPA: integrase core domain-containing protein [Solirubrobacterales bacterium]|nr:integrase core domain-containing protein [Solirubrobacterales bacterium]
MARPRKYPIELLDRGVRLVFESERPIAEVARDLGIHPEALRKRVRQVEADTGRQELTDHRVLASVGSVGDAYDNAMAESFVDSLKTELVRDRVFRTRSQLELAVIEWVSWFNNVRLHSEIGDVPPVEFESLYARQQPREISPSMKEGSPNQVSVELGPAHWPI